jgi:hypothetical protein
MVTMGPLGSSIHNYGPTAGAFVPERWLTDAAASGAAASDDGLGRPLTPEDDGSASTAAGGGGGGDGPPDPLTFSLGPRDCVGQTLARLELQVVVASLVARFNWTPGQRLQGYLDKELQEQQAGGDGRELGGVGSSAAVKALYQTAQYHITLQPGQGELLLQASART